LHPGLDQVVAAENKIRSLYGIRLQRQVGVCLRKGFLNVIFFQWPPLQASNLSEEGDDDFDAFVEVCNLFLS